MTTTDETPAKVRGIELDPGRVYREEELIAASVFGSAELRAARDSGKLRANELTRGKRVYLGRWILDWLTGATEGGSAA